MKKKQIVKELLHLEPGKYYVMVFRKDIIPHNLVEDLQQYCRQEDIRLICLPTLDINGIKFMEQERVL